MPSVIACPACSGQLRLPDDLLGQEVRCPACSHVFIAATVPEVPAPSPRHESLPLSLDNANGRALEPAARPRGLVGAVELKLSPDEEEAGPRPLAPPSRPRPPSADRGDSRRPRDWGDRDYELDSGRRRNGEPERRDRQPNRGVMILVLGIISLLCLTVFLSPLGVVLGLIAWVMGHGDLKRMKAQEIDPDGGLTKGGWICGILGTLLNTLLTLGCLTFFSLVLLEDSSRPPASYNQPIQYRNPTPKDGGMKKDNNFPNNNVPPPPAPQPPQPIRPRQGRPRV